MSAAKPETAELPTPPRPLTWDAGLTTAWPLLVVGLVCGALLVAITIYLSFCGVSVLPFASLALDSGSVASVRGEVVSTHPVAINTPAGSPVRVRYRFRPIGAGGEQVGGTVEGSTTVGPQDAGLLEQGASVMVRFVLDSPTVNRLDEFAPYTSSLGVRILLGVLLAGAALLPIWLRSVMVRRLVLRDGLRTSGRVVAWRGVPGLNPPHRFLTIRFHDEQGHAHDGRVFVSAASRLARAAADLGPAGTSFDSSDLLVPLLYDRRNPSRIALAEAGSFATNGRAPR